MSTRKITKEQFSDGSTIDGSRISRALTDIVEYSNEIPLEAISKSRAPQFVVLGAYPQMVVTGAPITTSPPWLNYNLADALGNPIFRAKGIEASVLSSGNYPTDDGGLWTASTLFDRPVIIDTISVHIDSWDDWPIKLTGPGASAFDEASLLQILIDTDNVHAPEDRTMNSKEIHYRQFDPTVWYAKGLNNGVAPTVDMEPAPPTKLKDGTAAEPSYVIERKNLNLPIHQFARVRFRLAFARQDTSVTGSGNASWESDAGSNTMHPGQPTFVIVYREQLRE
mgnify:CR=1 FL=1